MHIEASYRLQKRSQFAQRRYINPGLFDSRDLARRRITHPLRNLDRSTIIGIVQRASPNRLAQSPERCKPDAHAKGASGTMVGPAVMILGLSAIISSFHHVSESLLVGSGQTHIVLVASIARLVTVIPASLLGYGFLWFNLVAALILLAYYYIEQERRDPLRLSSEVRMLCVR